MRKIDWTRQFKRDYKKVQSSPRYRNDLGTLLPTILDTLVVDQELEPRLKDHALTGEMSGFRECHLRPDLLLVYAKAEDPSSLILMRLGSHSELFEFHNHATAKLRCPMESAAEVSLISLS